MLTRDDMLALGRALFHLEYDELGNVYDRMPMSKRSIEGNPKRLDPLEALRGVYGSDWGNESNPDYGTEEKLDIDDSLFSNPEEETEP